MSYIFMDESGDLGFDINKKNSKYFIVTFLFTNNKKQLDKVIKNIFRNLSKKSIKVSGGVLHCTKEKSSTRKKLLKKLSDKNIHIMTIYLNKDRVYTHLQDEKHILYNYIVNILLDRILNKSIISYNSEIEFIASQRETNKFLNQNFIEYLNNKTVSHPFNLKFSIKTPSEEKGLQAVDFACWGIYQKYERGNFEYHEIIKEKIIEEKALFG